MSIERTGWPNYVAWEQSAGRQITEDCLTHQELFIARNEGIARVIPYRYNKAMRVIAGRLSAAFPHDFDSDAGFLEAANDTQGPIVEIGGPTPEYGWPLHSVREVAQATGKPVVIGNKYPVKGIDVQTDGKRMPFASETVGVLMASCLPHGAREKIFEEAHRVLEPSGVFAYNRCRDLDVDHAMALGFKILNYAQYESEYMVEESQSWVRDRTWVITAQKPSDQTD